MLRLMRVLVPLLLFAGTAAAQSNPNFVNGQIPTVAQWNSYFSYKADVTNGTLTSPTITNPSISGTVYLGTTLFSGALTVSGSVSGTSGSFNTLTIAGQSLGTAASAALGTTGSTVPLLSGANTWGGAQHFGSNTIDGTAVAFTGGTLTGLTITNPTLTGTIAGAPTVSGNVVFSGNPNFSGNPTFAGTPNFSSGAGISFAQNSVTAQTTDHAELIGQLNGTVNGSQIYQYIIGCSSCYNADGVRGVATATGGSTTANVNGVGGYVLNQNANGGLGQNSVALFGVGVSAVNSAETWGVNTNLTDNTSQATSSGTGRVLNNEFDFNVTSTSTQINGLVIQGNSLAQPTSANGFVVSPLHIGTYSVVWNNSFYSGNGAATVAMYVGTLGTPAAANASSQPIAFIRTDASDVQHNDQIYTTPNGMVITAAALLPSVTSTNNLGSPSLQWQSVYATTLVISAGGEMNGGFSGNPAFSGNPVFSGTPSFTNAAGLTVQGAASTVFTVNAAQITGQLNGTNSSNAIFNFSSGCALCYNADAIRGVATNTNGSTATNVNGIAGYVYGLNPSSGSGQNSVAVYGVAVVGVNSGQAWGINTNVTDNTSQVSNSGTGRILNNEFDFNVTSPNTAINGLILQGNSQAQPASSIGVTVLNLKIGTFTYPWTDAFFSGNGAATVALYAGTSGAPTANNASSQPIAFINTNGSAQQQVSEIYSAPTGLIATNHWQPSANNAYNLGSATLAWQNLYLASGTLSITGTLPSGTAATYACFTSAGKLISSASAC